MRMIGGRFALVTAKEPLLKIFRITALDQVFSIYKTVPAALAEA
jgi:anti-sigma B factor antagonist